MSYYTDYCIKVNNVSKEEFDTIITKLEEISDEHFDVYLDYDFGLYAKWYDYEKDIAIVSKLYPKALFTVECKGEDFEQWIVYIQNGKSQIAEVHITYDSFDPSKLKDIKNE